MWTLAAARGPDHHGELVALDRERAILHHRFREQAGAVRLADLVDPDLSGGGLGFFIWNSYVGGSYEQIVVGMISIGIAGYACSEVLRALGGLATPWLKKR